MLEVMLDISIIRIIRLRIIASRDNKVIRRWRRCVIIEIIAIIMENGIKEEGINVRVIVVGE